MCYDENNNDKIKIHEICAFYLNKIYNNNLYYYRYLKYNLWKLNILIKLIEISRAS